MTNDKRVVFLRGRLVNLRPFERADIPALTRWINDPDVRLFIRNNFPQTEKNEEDWFNKMGSNESNVVLAIETTDGVLIGSMGLHRIDWTNRTATTGALIGEKEYWGRGFGTDAKMILLEYAFNTLNLRKICSEAFAFNKRSVRYSMHCGYKVEGTKKRHHFWGGRYWDVIQLSLFKRDWLPIWKKYKKTGSVR